MNNKINSVSFSALSPALVFLAASGWLCCIAAMVSTMR